MRLQFLWATILHIKIVVFKYLCDESESDIKKYQSSRLFVNEKSDKCLVTDLKQNSKYITVLLLITVHCLTCT